jgi:hypothetical protein
MTDNKIKIGQRYKALQTIGDGNPVITKGKIYNIIDIDYEDGYNSGYYINDLGEKDFWIEKTWNNKEYFELVEDDNINGYYPKWIYDLKGGDKLSKNGTRIKRTISQNNVNDKYVCFNDEYGTDQKILYKQITEWDMYLCKDDSDKVNEINTYNIYINKYTQDKYKVDYVDIHNNIVVLDNIVNKNMDKVFISVKDFYDSYKKEDKTCWDVNGNYKCLTNSFEVCYGIKKGDIVNIVINKDNVFYFADGIKYSFHRSHLNNNNFELMKPCVKEINRGIYPDVVYDMDINLFEKINIGDMYINKESRFIYTIINKTVDSHLTDNNFDMIGNVREHRHDEININIKRFQEFFNRYKRLPNRGEYISIPWHKGKDNHIEEVGYIDIKNKIIHFKNPKEHVIWNLDIIGKSNDEIERGDGLAWEIIEREREEDKVDCIRNLKGVSKISTDIDNKFIYEIGKTKVKTISPNNFYNFEGVIVGDYHDGVKNETLYNVLDERSGQTFLIKRNGFEVIEEKENDIIPNWIRKLKAGDKIGKRGIPINRIVCENNKNEKYIYVHDEYGTYKFDYKTLNSEDYFLYSEKDNPYLKYPLSNSEKLRSECAICGDITGTCKHGPTKDNNPKWAELMKKWDINGMKNNSLNDWTEQYKNHWTIQQQEEYNIVSSTSASDILYGKKDIIIGDTNYTRGITYGPEFKPEVWKVNK